MNKHFHTDGLIRDTQKVTHLPSQTVVNVIGSYLGDSVSRDVTREGAVEAARRLSHALAEMAGVLDSAHGSTEDRSAVEWASRKAKDTLKEWGVA